MSNIKPVDVVLLVGAILVVLVVSAIVSLIGNPGGEWYMGLVKPVFTPPNWVFPIVWFVLYILIAYAGWATFLHEPDGQEIWIWAGQLVLNWAWIIVFFGFHAIWLGFVIIVVVALMTLWFVAREWKKDMYAALAMIPYLIWITFAAILNLFVGLSN